LKKTKYFIPANGAVTYQYRDPRNWMMTPKGLDADDYRIQGRTRTLLIIAKPVDSANIDQGLRVGVTRTYKFTIQNTNVVDRGFLELNKFDYLYIILFNPLIPPPPW